MTIQVEELVEQLKAEEFQDVDLDAIDVSFSELAGVTPEELQSFLEDKVGISPDEGVQGTIGSLIVTPATHC